MKSNEIYDRKLKSIAESAKNAFLEQSDNYKQKLVYNLLNTINASDYEKFQWMVLRAANSSRRGAKDFVDSLKEFQVEMKTKKFEDIAYAVVMGIMSSYSKKEE